MLINIILQTDNQQSDTTTPQVVLCHRFITDTKIKKHDSTN